MDGAGQENRTGKVVDAAIREPVSLTKHGTAALVILSRDEFDRFLATDPRRPHGLNELPADWSRDLVESLEAVNPDSYGDD